MAVRNFWIEGQVDGRTTKLTGGPRSKDGGFSLTVKMRDNGEITKPLVIEGYAGPDGYLTLIVNGERGMTVTEDGLGVMLRKVAKR